MKKESKYIKPALTTLIMTGFLLSFFVSAYNANAATKEQKGKKDQVQRKYTENFDLQKNTVSNFQFPVTNYGILFLDVAQNRGGGFWPRGSLNQYLFGGGLWFGARKFIPADSLELDGNGVPTGDTVHYMKLAKLVEVTYNPNTGQSWMVPGRIEDGDLIDNTDILKYRTYFSTDFRPSDGSPLVASDGTNWPIWDASTNPYDTLKYDRYFGNYITEPNERNLTFNKKGPAFISGEDIFCTFKDTDLNSFEGGVQMRRDRGYPLRLQFEQYVYSWGFGDYKDFIFIRYDIINKSPDTLRECWIAPVMDVDIALSPNTQAGAGNDKAKYYDTDSTLNLAVQWTNSNLGEDGKGFGYLAFDFLESPAVHHCEWNKDTVVNGVVENYCFMCLERDTVSVPNWSTQQDPNDFMDSIFCIKDFGFPKGATDFPRKDMKWFPNHQQLGLRTFRRWPIEEDRNDDDPRYDYIAQAMREPGESEPGDYRFLMATGPFNILPGDTVRTVVGMILANSLDKNATGTTADLAETIRKDIFAQRVYDNNFRAPTPPDKSDIYYYDPQNSSIAITWDTTAEMSLDPYERGMDFMGFRLYRARRSDLDTFDVDQIKTSIQYPSGKGPFGWKQIGQWGIPTPFNKSVRRAGNNPNNLAFPLIDSLQIVGPEFQKNPDGTYLKDINNNLILDTFAIKVMKIAKGLMPIGPMTFVKKNMKIITEQLYTNRLWNYDNTWNVFILGIDTAQFFYPWGKYFNSLTNTQDFPLWYDPYNPEDPKNKHFLLDSVLIGTIKLDRSLLDYNPLYWNKVTTNINPSDTTIYNSYPGGMDTATHIKYLTNTYRYATIDGTTQLIMDKLLPVDFKVAMTDSILIKKALDSVYTYIQNGLCKFDCPDFEGRKDVRQNVIAPIMKEITRGHRFYDIGDDDRSGELTFDLDPVKTEKLINNVPYYYKILAYDEGDYMQPTPGKLNSGFVGLPNVQTTYPRAAVSMDDAVFKVLSLDSAKIGGLYNFKLFGYDNQRIRQLFSGHTLEMEFTPRWNKSELELQKTTDNIQRKIYIPFSLYNSTITIKDITDSNRLLFQIPTYLEQTSGDIQTRGGFTENAQSWVVDNVPIEDPVSHTLINIAEVANDTVITRSSIITTGDFKQKGYFYTQGFVQPAYGTLGFSFNYTAQQRGGIYRPDSSSIYPPEAGRVSPIVKGDAQVPINFMSDLGGDLRTTYSSEKLYRTQTVGFNVYGNSIQTYDSLNQIRMSIRPEFAATMDGSYNNGPASYLIEFKPGGQETLRLKSSNNPTPKDYVFNYLLMDVKNVISYKRPSSDGDSVDVTYPLPIEHMSIDTGSNNFMFETYLYPNLNNIGTNSNDFIGKYNLSSYGWINGSKATTFALNKTYAVPEGLNVSEGTRVAIGQQGRYYTIGVSTDGMDTCYITNAFLASGVTFVFDKAKNQVLSGVTRQWTNSSEAKNLNVVEFDPGDQVLLKTNGGALGFPLPGAKVQFYIDSNIVAQENITDNQMDQVSVVPNPYYITHQAQASPYDAKIYFTKLPKKATINIYTVMGDLVKTLEHDEYINPDSDKSATEIWDLLSKNRQRVQSQTFVAVITAENGAQTVKEFSVVVGGFRLIPEN